MLSALEAELGGRATWSTPEGGYFLWLELGVETDDLLGRAREAGVTFVPGSDFFLPGEGGETAARLAFSYVSTDEITEGVSRLASLVAAAAA